MPKIYKVSFIYKDETLHNSSIFFSTYELAKKTALNMLFRTENIFKNESDSPDVSISEYELDTELVLRDIENEKFDVWCETRLSLLKRETTSDELSEIEFIVKLKESNKKNAFSKRQTNVE